MSHNTNHTLRVLAACLSLYALLPTCLLLPPLLLSKSLLLLLLSAIAAVLRLL
jgi:hypothetical protein